MNKNIINRVCVVDTVYTLFLYLLLSTENEVNNTFFFWSSGIPENIRMKFKDQSFYFKPQEFNRFSYCFFNIKVLVQKFFQWPFLLKKNISYWGHTHLFFSSGIIGNHEMNLIEDGIGNYKYFDVDNSCHFKWVKSRLFGSYFLPEKVWGENIMCKNIYLTGLMETPKEIKNKVRFIDINRIWSLTTENKKNFILDIYGLDKNDIQLFNNKTDLLLTQCFSEDERCSEAIKIQIYKDLINQFCEDSQNLIIKPHPREKTDYAKLFPNITIYKKKVPMEILLLLGTNLKRIITINSSVAYNLPQKVEAVIIGDKIIIEYNIRNNK